MNVNKNTYDKHRPLSDRTNLCAGLGMLPGGCRRFIQENEASFLAAPGSSYNHQFERGGIADHLDEIFAIAGVLYRSFSDMRSLPFTLEDALLVLFLHDVEKCFKRLEPETPRNLIYERMASEPAKLQEEVARDYQLRITPSQQNALTYVHGEGD